MGQGDPAEAIFFVTRKGCRNNPPSRSNLASVAEALPDLHRHVPVFVGVLVHASERCC